MRSEEHTSELQSHRDLHSFPTRRSSDLVQSLSTGPLMKWRIPGPDLEFEDRWLPASHPETPDAPTRDMSITVGWNTAKAAGITREHMDAWALRSHQRAIA